MIKHRGRPAGPVTWRVYGWTGHWSQEYGDYQSTRFIAFATSPNACAKLAGAASSTMLRELAESVNSLEIQSAQQYPGRVLCRPIDAASGTPFTVLPPPPRYY